MLAVAAFPAARIVPAGRERVLRRLRRVVRRRVRVDLNRLGTSTIAATDGTLAIRMRAGLDPRQVAWESDRPVELVVLYTGCGVRLAGAGGFTGELRLPAAPCADAYLAFCYDDVVDGAIPA